MCPSLLLMTTSTQNSFQSPQNLQRMILVGAIRAVLLRISVLVGTC